MLKLIEWLFLLLLEQVVTCVPTSKLPKCFSMARATPEEIAQIDRKGSETDDDQPAAASGQVLWLRGLTFGFKNQVGWLSL